MKHLFPIDGMHCQACIEKVTAALRSVAGVSEVEVTLDPPQAAVTAIPSIDTAKLGRAVEKAGPYSLVQSGQFDEINPISPSASALAETRSKKTERWGKTEIEQGIGAYFPLILIFNFLIGGVLIREIVRGNPDWMAMMANFMGGFFVVFSFFKLLDISGFAQAYRGYDLLAKKLPIYGYIYPLLELGLGVSFLIGRQPLATNLAAAALMAFSGWGVYKSLIRGEEIVCACLGTVFKFPMSKVTLFEDGLMILMALIMILARAISGHW